MENLKYLGRIAYIDDDEDDRQFFLEALNEIQSNVDLTLYENGKTFIDDIKGSLGTTNIPELIFLDINMPIMNGYECLFALKHNTYLSRIPVIIYSTSASAIDRKRLKELGAYQFLTKQPSHSKMVNQLRFALANFFLYENFNVDYMRR